ncbi:MAG: DNA/RNA non-specific endonuclease [Prevotella sp.]|nr:DNA/RNA non-specific endonuclease [Prevotella sp.]
MKQHFRLFLYATLTALVLTACSSDDDDVKPSTPSSQKQPNLNANDNSLQPELSRLEFPHVKGGNSIVVIHKTNDSYDPDGISYSLEWDCQKKSQRWSCFQMHTAGTTTGRTNAWAEDPDIPSSARFSDTNAMYKGSGFTRGHICASADRLYSAAANMQTFYYSNMQPQLYNFNAGDNYTGVWVHMEDQVRSWVSKCDTLYVVKGGTIDRADQILMRIKPNVEGGLIVPKYFFMALLAKSGNTFKALGFWAEHNDVVLPSIDLKDYVVSIDELEELTGIDFFCNLPDPVEKTLEGLSRESICSAWFK